MSDTIIQNLRDAKAAVKKGPVEGLRFQVEATDNPTVIPEGGIVYGTVLKDLSPKGKVQAELTCVVKGCTELHIREQSDWHQSCRCRTHAKTKGKMTVEEKIAKAKAKLMELQAQAA